MLKQYINIRRKELRLQINIIIKKTFKLAIVVDIKATKSKTIFWFLYNITIIKPYSHMVLYNLNI